MKKRILAFTVAVIIVFSLVLTGCQDKEGKGPGKLPQGEGPLGKYNPEIEITYARPWYPNMLVTMQEKNFTLEKNPWIDAIKRDLGVNLVLEWAIADSAAYFTKLNAQIIIGDIPDIVNVGSGTAAYISIRAMYDNDLLADLTKDYENYASEELKEINNASGKEIFFPATHDNKLVSLPQIVGGENDAWCFFWVRSDWMETLGLDEPTDLNGLTDIIKAFRDGDPDGDGNKNTYGLAWANDYYEFGKPIFNAFHSYPRFYIEAADGTLTYGSITPETKQALAYLRDLYNGGYIDPDFNNYNSEVAVNKIKAGEIGIWPGKVHNGLILTNTVVNNPQADFEPFVLVSADDKPVKAQCPIHSYQYFISSEKNPAPEFLVKIFNYFLDVSHRPNEQIVDMISDEKGRELWQLAPTSTGRPGKNLIRATNLQKAYEEGSPDSLTDPVDRDVYSWVMDFKVNNNYEMWGWDAIYGVNGSEYKIKVLLENNYNGFIFDKFVGAPTDSMNLYLSELLAKEITAFTQIITGEQSLEYFDAFVNEWKAAGGDDILREVNDWYKSFK